MSWPHWSHRRHLEGAWQTAHLDPLNTHVITAEIHLGHKVTESRNSPATSPAPAPVPGFNPAVQGADWPLYLRDHNDQVQEVFLEQGQVRCRTCRRCSSKTTPPLTQVLWYESALLPHGRPSPYQGHSYDSVQVHFKPAGRVWYREGMGERGGQGRRVGLEEGEAGRRLVWQT